MAQRERKKGKRAAAGRQAAAPAQPASVEARFKAAVRECEQLRSELERAKARIAALEVLEEQRLQLVNRIDWVIDSLHNVLEGDT